MDPDRQSQIELMERDCAALKEILEKHASTQDQRRAFKTAISAYAWIYLKDDLRAEFNDFQEHLYDPPTDEERQRWKDRRIDFNADSPDENNA